MTKIREEQFKGITNLDSEGTGTVDVSSAILENTLSTSYINNNSSPNTNSVWVKNNPSTLIFTDTNGVDHVVNRSLDIELWVDPVSGSDSALGTQINPLASLDEALIRLGPIIDGYARIYLMPHPDANGYDSEEFRKARLILGTLEIIGVGQTSVAGPFTLTSRSGGYLYDFSGDTPGWTYDANNPEVGNEWVGYDLLCTSGACEGQTRTIAFNREDTLQLLYRHDAYPSFTPPSPGDTFEIVRPSVAIRMPLGTSMYGGGYTSPYLPNTDAFYNRLDGSLILRNLELRVDDNVNPYIYAVGNFDLFGVHFTHNTSSYAALVFQNGRIGAGRWIHSSVQGVDGEYLYGWGLCTRSRQGLAGDGTPIQRKPILEMHNCEAQMYYAGGPIKCVDTTSNPRTNSIDGRKHNVRGLLHLQKSNWNAFAFGYLHFFINGASTSTGGFDVHIQNKSFYEIFGGNHFHYSDGGVFRAWWYSDIYLTGSPCDPNIAPEGSTPSLPVPQNAHSDNQWVSTCTSESTIAFNGQYNGSIGDMALGWHHTDIDIIDASNTTPIVITTDGYHGLKNNQIVYIEGVLGNTAANGNCIIKWLSYTTFSIQDIETGQDIAGNGIYTSNGNVYTAFIEVPQKIFYTGEIISGTEGSRIVQWG